MALVVIESYIVSAHLSDGVPAALRIVPDQRRPRVEEPRWLPISCTALTPGLQSFLLGPFKIFGMISHWRNIEIKAL